MLKWLARNELAAADATIADRNNHIEQLHQELIAHHILVASLQQALIQCLVAQGHSQEQASHHVVTEFSIENARIKGQHENQADNTTV